MTSKSMRKLLKYLYDKDWCLKSDVETATGIKDKRVYKHAIEEKLIRKYQPLFDYPLKIKITEKGKSVIDNKNADTIRYVLSLTLSSLLALIGYFRNEIISVIKTLFKISK